MKEIYHLEAHLSRIHLNVAYPRYIVTVNSLIFILYIDPCYFVQFTLNEYHCGRFPNADGTVGVPACVRACRRISRHVHTRVRPLLLSVTPIVP